MNISGNAICFVENRKDFNKVSTTISKKAKDGTYSNYYVEVHFVNDAESLIKVVKDHTKGYELDVKEGFISFETYINKAKVEVKKPVFVITKADLTRTFDLDLGKKTSK